MLMLKSLSDSENFSLEDPSPTTTTNQYYGQDTPSLRSCYFLEIVWDKHSAQTLNYLLFAGLM